MLDAKFSLQSVKHLLILGGSVVFFADISNYFVGFNLYNRGYIMITSENTAIPFPSSDSESSQDLNVIGKAQLSSIIYSTESTRPDHGSIEKFKIYAFPGVYLMYILDRVVVLALIIVVPIALSLVGNFFVQFMATGLVAFLVTTLPIILVTIGVSVLLPTMINAFLNWRQPGCTTLTLRINSTSPTTAILNALILFLACVSFIAGIIFFVVPLSPTLATIVFSIVGIFLAVKYLFPDPARIQQTYSNPGFYGVHIDTGDSLYEDLADVYEEADDGITPNVAL